MPLNSSREMLAVEVRRDVPERPGVYTWLDARGACLYVGKSVNLRSRMLSYLAPSATAPDARMRRLAFSVRGFTIRETEGELLALLLEDALIKQLNPPHNERQRDYRERRYLLLTHDPYPACLVVEAPGARPGALFGPFKDRHLAARVLAVVTDEFGLRACTDAQPYRRSLRFDLGLCTGPCRGAVNETVYAETAARTAAFLAGDDAWIGARLEEAIAAAVADLEFERAALLRERRAFCTRFAQRQRFANAFRDGQVTVAEPATGLRYRFEHAALVAVSRSGGGQVEVPPELRDPPVELRHVLDRAGVVLEWTRRAARDVTDRGAAS